MDPMQRVDDEEIQWRLIGKGVFSVKTAYVVLSMAEELSDTRMLGWLFGASQDPSVEYVAIAVAPKSSSYRSSFLC